MGGFKNKVQHPKFQGMMQVDHLIEAVTKKIGGDGHMDLKNSQTAVSIENQYGSFAHWECP
jgi:hypothetical protein